MIIILSLYENALSVANLMEDKLHPLSDDVERQKYIDQTRISHIVENIWFEGNIVKGRVAAAATSVGKDFAGLIRQGMEVAFSMRGLGGIVKESQGYVKVDDPIYIIAYDWVLTPSHMNAYQTNIVKESINNPLFESTNKGKQIPISNNSLNDYILQESANIRSIINEMEINYDPNQVTLENNSFLSLKDKKHQYNLFIEEKIQKEINDYMKFLI